jgi:predicted PurR-regulated permease PerM
LLAGGTLFGFVGVLLGLPAAVVGVLIPLRPRRAWKARTTAGVRSD